MGQKTCAPWHEARYIVHGLDLFVNYGFYFVSVFMFCTGYGLYKSVTTKDITVVSGCASNAGTKTYYALFDENKDLVVFQIKNNLVIISYKTTNLSQQKTDLQTRVSFIM